MKIALSCDHLLEDDHRIEILKFFLSLWPNAHIHTLAHRSDGVDLDGYPVHVASYSRMASSMKKFARYSFLIPGFVKKAKMPDSLDLIINLSSGLSHGLLKNRNTRQITYLYSWDFQENQRGLSEFFFRSFRYKWAFESLRQSDFIFVPSFQLASLIRPYVDEKKINILQPFLNERVMDQDFQEKTNGHLLSTMGLSEKRKRTIMNKLDDIGVNYTLFKEEMNDENLSLLISSQGLIDFSRSYFPFASLCAVANGENGHIVFQRFTQRLV